MLVCYRVRKCIIFSSSGQKNLYSGLQLPLREKNIGLLIQEFHRDIMEVKQFSVLIHLQERPKAGVIALLTKATLGKQFYYAYLLTLQSYFRKVMTEADA